MDCQSSENATSLIIAILKKFFKVLPLNKGRGSISWGTDGVLTVDLLFFS